jgi:hypothetical protein
MAKATKAETIIYILGQFNLNEQNHIKPEQITKPKINRDETGYFYHECSLDINVGVGHTVILIGDKDGEFHEKLEYFKKQYKKTGGFQIFSDVYGYTDFMITIDGSRVPGYSLVLKHKLE